MLGVSPKYYLVICVLLSVSVFAVDGFNYPRNGEGERVLLSATPPRPIQSHQVPLSARPDRQSRKFIGNPLSKNIVGRPGPQSQTYDPVPLVAQTVRVGQKRLNPYGNNPPAKKRCLADINPDRVAYWRIAPGEERHFELCDAEGGVLCTLSVKTKFGKLRKLNQGCLRVKDKHIKRAPKDTADLKENGFVLKDGDKIKIYDPSALRKIVPCPVIPAPNTSESVQPYQVPPSVCPQLEDINDRCRVVNSWG